MGEIELLIIIIQSIVHVKHRSEQVSLWYLKETFKDCRTSGTVTGSMHF